MRTKSGVTGQSASGMGRMPLPCTSAEILPARHPSGPRLRRPVIGEIQSSRHKNMKEMRVDVGDAKLRVLFIFDPRREAVLLLGGDKAERSAWSSWYGSAVPRADDLYEEYLHETKLHEQG